MPSETVERDTSALELAVKPGRRCDQLFFCPLLNWDSERGGERLPDYLKMVFLLNFSVNFLLLLSADRIFGCPSAWLQCLLSALLGGLYGAGCLLPGFSFLGSPLWRLVSFALMGFLAFGWSRSAVQRSCIFFILSMALGGIAISAAREERAELLLWALLLLGLCWLGFGGKGGQKYRILKLARGEKTVSLLALQDTGNTLRDPVTGEGVVIISPAAARNLTGLTDAELRSPLETMARHPLPGLRLIPYRTVGSCGMLLGLRIREAELDGKKKSLLVAFAPEGLGNGDAYQALTGGSI